MTKNEIKAELLRSACEDKDPWSGIEGAAWYAARNWQDPTDERMLKMSVDRLRILYLLVAEAM